ncbi:MAG: winged helix-turn-helix domain-containing protein [candidate division WOR-3 bacterium]
MSDKIAIFTKVLKAVANEKRLRILKIMLDGKAREIGEISELVNLPYKTTARNLKILERAHFLKSTFNHGNSYYSLKTDRNLKYNTAILKLIAE